MNFRANYSSIPGAHADIYKIKYPSCPRQLTIHSDMHLITRSPGHYFDLISYKAYADLKAEAARTYVNYLWWILDPLMSLTVYYTVFGLLLQRGGSGFIFTLLAGLIFWRWYSEAISHGSSTIYNGTGLMNQIDMPKWIFPLVCFITDSTKFLFTLVLLLIILLLLGPGLQATYLALPLLLIVQVVLIIGISFTISALVPLIPDLRHIINTLLMLQMFLSGIFYTTDQIPEAYLGWFFLNPMARMVHEYREILLHNRWPDMDGLTYVLMFGLVFLAFGFGLIRRFDKTYPRLS